jgi:hypothetical protein
MKKTLKVQISYNLGNYPVHIQIGYHKGFDGSLLQKQHLQINGFTRVTSATTPQQGLHHSSVCEEDRYRQNTLATTPDKQ